MMNLKEQQKLGVLLISGKKGERYHAVLVEDILRHMDFIEYEIDKVRNFEGFNDQDYANMWIVLKQLLVGIEQKAMKGGPKEGK
jgi:hypothetical protein